MHIDLKKYRTDFLIIVGFALLSLAYCYPRLQGKVLRQSDIVNWQCMSREATAYHDSTGNDVLWSNSMFGGMPTYTYFDGVAGTNYPFYIQSVLSQLGKPAYFFFTAMVCFFMLISVLGINKWMGVAGAIAYALSSYNSIIIAQGHETKMMAIAYLPAAIAGAYLIFRQKWWAGAALFSLTISLVFSTKHYQIVYYLLIMLFCFIIGMLIIAIKERKLKVFFISTLIAIGSAALGIGPNLPLMMSTAEYSKETMRGGGSELSGHDAKNGGGLDKDYAFNWSNGIGETFCLMVPYLYGGGSDGSPSKAPKTNEATHGSEKTLPIYWGKQPWISGPVFFGAVVCFLYLLGMLAIRSPQKWWMLAACVIGIVLSWGKNFQTINFYLFDHIPMLNKFRTVTMALVIPQFLFPLVGVWSIHEIAIQKDKRERLLNALMWAAYISIGACLAVGALGRLFFDFSGPADDAINITILPLLKEDRAALALSSSLKSGVLIFIAAILVWAFIKEKIKLPLLASAVGLLIVCDLLPVASEYLNANNYVDASDYEAIFSPGELDKVIFKDRDPYFRVLVQTEKTYHSAVQTYFHKCIGGYHPAKLQIYQDLIDSQLGDNYNVQIINMLNAKYIISQTSDLKFKLTLNINACGNAWFADEIKWVGSADEEMHSLNAIRVHDSFATPNAFDPRKTAIIRMLYKNEAGNSSIGHDSLAFIKLDKYGLDDISFISSNSKDGLGVFSDIFYNKGWKAYIDGKETPILKADYVLRAVKIPAGNHHIEFLFKPASYYSVRWIAMSTSILLVCLCCIAFLLSIRSKTVVTEK